MTLPPGNPRTVGCKALATCATRALEKGELLVTEIVLNTQKRPLKMGGLLVTVKAFLKNRILSYQARYKISLTIISDIASFLSLMIKW